MSIEEKIARRAAREVQPGNIVNLGIGMPTQILRYLPDGFSFVVMSENGIVGMGPPAERGCDSHHLPSAGAKTAI